MLGGLGGFGLSASALVGGTAERALAALAVLLAVLRCVCPRNPARNPATGPHE